MGLGETFSNLQTSWGPRVGSAGKGFSLWAVRVRDPALPGIDIEEKPELSRPPPPVPSSLHLARPLWEWGAR